MKYRNDLAGTLWFGSAIVVVILLSILAQQLGGVEPIGPSFDLADAAADPAAALAQSQATAEQTQQAVATPWWQIALSGLLTLATGIAATRFGPIANLAVGLLRRFSPTIRTTLDQGDRAIGRANAGAAAIASTEFGRALLRQLDDMVRSKGWELSEAIGHLSGGRASTIDGLLREGLIRYQTDDGSRGAIRTLRAEVLETVDTYDGVPGGERLPMLPAMLSSAVAELTPAPTAAE